MKIPAQTVINTDVEIAVRSDGVPLGKVEISKGSIDWTPSPNSLNYFHMTWEKFDEIMRERGLPRKKKK